MFDAQKQPTTACDLCGKPLSAGESQIGVTAHFPCVFNAAYGEETAECSHCGGREKCKPGCDALDARF